MSEIILGTERLQLRRWKTEDLEQFVELNQDPEVRNYLPNPYTPSRACEVFELIEEEFQKRGYSLMAVDEKMSGNFIGYVGLHHTQLSFMTEEIVEIGWRLKKEFWGRGYATEAAKACLEYAFNDLELSEIYSFTAELNTPSRKVMEKLGMTFIREFLSEHVDDGHPLQKHVLYKISSKAR